MTKNTTGGSGLAPDTAPNKSSATAIVHQLAFSRLAAALEVADVARSYLLRAQEEGPSELATGFHPTFLITDLEAGEEFLTLAARWCALARRAARP